MKNIPTRVLLTTAAIGVAGAVVIAPLSMGSSAAPALLLPLVYSAVLGLKLLPGIIAQALLHRPGVALGAALVSGLIAVPFSGRGAAVVLSIAGIGLLQEIPFALGLYRRWGAWIHYAAAVPIGLVLAWLGVNVLGIFSQPVLVQVLFFVVAVVSCLVATWIARAVAAGVERTGVVRGLRPARRERAGA